MRQAILIGILCAHSFAATLGFDDVLDKTLQNDKNLKISDVTSKIAKQEANKKFAEMFGVVNVSETYSNTNNPMYVFSDKLSSRQATFNDFGVNQYNPSNPNVAPSNLNNPGALNNYETAIEYNVPLFSGFAQKNAYEASKLDIQAKAQSYEWDKKALSLKTLQAYNQAITAKHFVDVANDAKKSAEALYNRVDAFYEQKLASKTNKLEAEWFNTKTAATLAKAEENYALSLATLRYLTGDSQLSGVGKLPNIKLPNKSQDELTNSIETREDISSVILQEKYANKMYSSAKGTLSPTINAFAKYATNSSSLTTSNNGSYYVGLALKYPIFDGGKDSSEREQARLNWTKANLAATQAKEDAKLGLEKAYLSVQTKQKIYTEKQKASELADELDEKYQIMYENGLTPLYERLKRLAAKAEARADMINAGAEAIYAVGELRVFSGFQLMENK